MQTQQVKLCTAIWHQTLLAFDTLENAFCTQAVVWVEL